jgi:hypothetical protein
MKYQQHTTTGVNIMKTVGDIFNEASDIAMFHGYAFGSELWFDYMNLYLNNYAL